MVAIDLDRAGLHRALVDGETTTVVAVDDVSRLRRLLRDQLVVRATSNGTCGSVGERLLFRVVDGVVVEHDPLTAFEARFLADAGVPLPPLAPQTTTATTTATTTTTTMGWSPRTDLHVHFAAALPGRALLELAARHGGVRLPRATADALGVGGVGGAGGGAGGDGNDDGVGVDEALVGLGHRLDVPLDRQITFVDMERLYARRAPLAKHPALFVAQLEAIAARYAAAGVVYAELSLSDVVTPERLAILHGVLDDLEARTGVRLRFLEALSRHDDLAWDLDVVDRVAACLGSRAVVGVDFMGHETNSTRAFVEHLRAAGALGQQRAGFVVRVHAGENPAFPENVREAVTTLLACDGVDLRIGHGLYGVDDDTLALLAAHPDRVVVEFNPTSNLALNNIQRTGEVPIARYVDAGVSVVAGSDGPGLYGTCAADELRALRLCGLSDDGVARLRSTEETLLARKRAQQEALPPLSSWNVPPRAPRVYFTPALIAEHEAARAAQQQAFRARAGDRVVDEVTLRARLAGKPVLWIAGAWRFSWTRLGDAERGRAASLVDDVVRGVAARGGVIVTGGTRDGVEGLVHACAAVSGVAVVGAVVDDTPVDALDDRVPLLWVCARTLYEKAAPLTALVRDVSGLALFVGGGVIVADEVQAAVNVGVRVAVARGVPGASDDACRVLPERACDDADDVLRLLDDHRPRGRLRHAGANDAADVVVVRRGPWSGADEVLLIRRHDDAQAAGGAFALPGGFLRPGEDAAAAAARELAEETGLVVASDRLVAVDVVFGAGRDPRDEADRFVRTHLFVVRVDDAGVLVAASDAARAFFVVVAHRPALAFDHGALLSRALAHPLVATSSTPRAGPA